MEIGDVIMINGVKHRILKDGHFNFCLNNLEIGGCIRFYGWKTYMLCSDSVEKLILGDILDGRAHLH
jgi:hypothetical protein